MFSVSEKENSAFSKKLRSQNVVRLWKRKSGILKKLRSQNVVVGWGGGFDRSHLPVVGTFDRFKDLSSNILLTSSGYFGNPQMPWGGAFEQKLSAQFKCPAYARPPPTPQQLKIDRCIVPAVAVVIAKTLCGRHAYLKKQSFVFKFQINSINSKFMRANSLQANWLKFIKIFSTTI